MLRNSMKETFGEIAKAIGYAKMPRLQAAIDEMDEHDVLKIVQSCITESYVILFFDCKIFQMTPFGFKYGIAGPRLNITNVLLMHPRLEEKFFREIFTGFELLVYKCCHIQLEKQRNGYNWESERTRTRFKKLMPLLALTNAAEYEAMFGEVFHVRDAFAHSFVDLEDIRFRGVPLSDCFGVTDLGASFVDYKRAGIHIFLDEMALLFDPLMQLFRSIQLKQIDARKFTKLCDQLVAPRSLLPR